MITQSVALDLVNGQQVFPVPGAGAGMTQQLVFTCDVYPAAGTLTLEYQLMGVGAWQPVYKGFALPLNAPIVLAAEGAVGAFRVALAGLGAGGSNLRVWAGSAPAGLGFPSGAFVGLRALTVQPYTEANVKNGVQFYARANYPLATPIPTGQSRKLHFTTGAKPVLVKLRDFSYVAEELRINLYRSPTGVSGGTPLVIHNYNGVNPVASTVAATKNVTTVTDGVEFDGGDPEFFFGANAVAQRVSTSIPQGRERVLPPNASFLVVITNTGTGDARCQYFLDWYEGGSDLPA